ncbi:MAG TPA: hypothetical protein VF365_00365 [Candidatus Limnocylindria bacterium]
MRAWAAAAGASLREVADRPALWLPGALAWLTTVGWVPFVIAVVSPPTVAELTYLGSRFWTSGLWPWNAVLVAAGAVALTVVALALASAANAVLIAAAERRHASGRDAGSLLVLALLGAVPVAFCALAIALGVIAVGPAEFNRPQAEASPVLRTAARLAPLLVFTAILALLASTVAGLAGRGAIRAGDAAAGVAAVPGLVRQAGRAGLVHVAAAAVVGLGHLALTGLLLTVLWAPIAVGLGAAAGIDLAAGLLLVGFVAIWLCLVLAGGVVHAWASMTASALLADRAVGPVPEPPLETLIDR